MEKFLRGRHAHEEGEAEHLTVSSPALRTAVLIPKTPATTFGNPTARRYIPDLVFVWSIAIAGGDGGHVPSVSRGRSRRFAKWREEFYLMYSNSVYVLQDPPPPRVVPCRLM